jgi:hypothetical protein
MMNKAAIISYDDGKRLLIATPKSKKEKSATEIPYDDIKRLKIRATQWRRFLIIERKNAENITFIVSDDTENVVSAVDRTLREQDESYRLYNERQDKKHEFVVALCVVAVVLFAPVSFAVLLLLPAVAGWSVFAVLSVVLIGLIVSTALT